MAKRNELRERRDINCLANIDGDNWRESLVGIASYGFARLVAGTATASTTQNSEASFNLTKNGHRLILV